jgi:hypothetical protein
MIGLSDQSVGVDRSDETTLLEGSCTSLGKKLEPMMLTQGVLHILVAGMIINCKFLDADLFSSLVQDN